MHDDQTSAVGMRSHKSDLPTKPQESIAQMVAETANVLDDAEKRIYGAMQNLSGPLPAGPDKAQGPAGLFEAVAANRDRTRSITMALNDLLNRLGL